METDEILKLRRFRPGSLEAKLYALERLSMRFPFISDQISNELAIKAFLTIASKQTNRYQKRAGRIILNLKLGIRKTNDVIEEIAVITDRNDPLVRRWRIAVLNRDNHKCIRCGNTENLVAHHKSHWADDPVNRINVDNGVTLCTGCHSKEHPELSCKMFGGDFSE